MFEWNAGEQLRFSCTHGERVSMYCLLKVYVDVLHLAFNNNLQFD